MLYSWKRRLFCASLFKGVMTIFKHLVLWRFSPQISSARQKVLISELNSRFRAMVGQVDGLLKAEVGQNLASNSEYHMILYTVFTSRKAMEAYQKHPLHLAVKKEMETIVCDRLPMDYEV